MILFKRLNTSNMSIIGNNYLLLTFSLSCPWILLALSTLPIPFVPIKDLCYLDALDLEEYASFFEDHSDMLMFYTPSFDRPLFSHTPTRDDFIILHPSLSSNSFLYVPITKEEVMSKEPPEELRQCWTSSLSKNAIDRVTMMSSCDHRF